jgi:hypothetical protein
MCINEKVIITYTIELIISFLHGFMCPGHCILFLDYIEGFAVLVLGPHPVSTRLYPFSIAILSRTESGRILVGTFWLLRKKMTPRLFCKIN